MILIVTNKIDAHADLIIQKMHELKIPFFRLNTEDLLTKNSFILSYDKNTFNGSIRNPLRKLDFSKIKSVWYRRPQRPHLTNIICNNDERIFIEKETEKVLEGLYSQKV